jgi:hypothetical protein
MLIISSYFIAPCNLMWRDAWGLMGFSFFHPHLKRAAATNQTIVDMHKCYVLRRLRSCTNNHGELRKCVGVCRYCANVLAAIGVCRYCANVLAAIRVPRY